MFFNRILKVLFSLCLVVISLYSQSSFAVSISNSTRAVIGNNNDTLSWQHNISSGAGFTNRKLIVGIGIEENSGSGDDVIASVTINNLPLARISQITVTSNNITERVEVWYMDDADLPNGNRTIRVRTTGNVREISAGAILLLNAEQGLPVAVTNSNIGPNSISTNITTTANNSWVVDVVGSGNPNSFTQGSGQVERWDTDQSIGNWTSASAASTKEVINMGTTTMTQNQNANRLAHIVLEIRPDTAGPPVPVTPIAEYRLDETTWNGTAGEVLDNSGNANHGSAISTGTTIFPSPLSTSPIVAGDPGTCGYAEIPLNTDVNIIQAIDTGVHVNNDIGNQGTISLWYKSNVDWNTNSQTRMIFDASDNGSGKYFYLSLKDNSRLEFGLEDTNDGDFRLETGAYTFTAGSWVHIAVSWNMATRQMFIYVNGTQAASYSIPASSTGILGSLNTLYLGDNRSTYTVTGRLTGNSANGSIDEARIYNVVRSQAEIDTDRLATHPCTIVTTCAGDYPVYSLGNLDISGTVTVNGNTVPNYDGTTNDAIDPTTGALLDITPAPVLPALNPASFPANTSNRDLNNPATVLGAPSDPANPSGYYDDITVNGTTTFSGGTYHIDTLTVGNGDTIILQAGDYFIDVLDMDTNSNLVIASGPVNIYINSDFSTENNVDLNAGGAASDLTINLYSNAEFELDNNGTFTGIIYSPFTNSEVDFDQGATITGAIITNGEVDIDNNTTITYGAAERAAAASVAQCTAGLHHIQIEHDGIGLNCQSEQITVKACGDASCDPANYYVGDVTVNLISSAGTWSSPNPVTISGGSTNFNLQVLTPTVVTLSASNPAPAASQNPVYTCVNSGPGNACDIEFFPSGLVFTIPTQTSCATSASISVQALGTDPANPAQCVPLFAPVAPATSITKSLKAWTTYVDPDNDGDADDIIGTPQVTLSGATPPQIPITQPVGDNVTLNFDANATANFTLSYPDAGELQLNMQFDGTGSEAGLQLLGNARFVTVPAQLNVFSPDVTSACASADPNNALCTPYVAAGDNFNLSVSGSCSDGTVTPNFRINGITLSSNLVAPSAGSGGVNATLGVPTINIIKAGGGTGIIANQTVSEVGVFTITATPPNNYLGVDFTTSPVTINPGTSPNLGRFYPHHFTTAVTNACTLGATPYTYAGEPFSVTMTAYNGLTPATVTTNYFADFVKDPTVNDKSGTYTLTNNVFTGTVHFTDTAAGTATNNNVTLTFVDKHTPPQTVIIQADETNATGSTTDDVSSDTYTEGSVLIRSGRAVLDNAYGPEQLPLTMPVRFEYYSDAGTPSPATEDDGFIVNTDDLCSNYTSAGSQLGNYTQTLIAGDTTLSGTGTALSGLYNPVNPLVLSAPLNAHHGNVNVLLSVDSWLEYNWGKDCDGNGSNDNGPCGTASFGLYRGDDRIIFQREVLP